MSAVPPVVKVMVFTLSDAEAQLEHWTQMCERFEQEQQRARAERAPEERHTELALDGRRAAKVTKYWHEAVLQLRGG